MTTTAGAPLRVVDHDVKPGVALDMGAGDAWPGLREQLVEADILVLSTPTWLGQQSSVATACVVGNEDGAHHISAALFQALNDVGFSLAAGAVTYWNDEAQGAARDYKDLPGTPAGVAATTRSVAANAAHLARLLRGTPYPPSS